MIFGKNHGNMRKRCGNHRFFLVVKVGDLLKKNNLEKIRSSFFLVLEGWGWEGKR